MGVLAPMCLYGHADPYVPCKGCIRYGAKRPLWVYPVKKGTLCVKLIWSNLNLGGPLTIYDLRPLSAVITLTYGRIWKMDQDRITQQALKFKNMVLDC